MNIMVTGATGFIGVKLVNELLKEKHSVRILTTSKEKAIKIFGNTVDIFVGNIIDKKSINCCCEDIDIVYHLVAKVGNERPSKENNKAFDLVNVEGLKNIAYEAEKAKVKRFIHISSIAAMGIVKDIVIDERSQCSPYLPYQTSKFKGEQFLNREYKNGKLNSIIVRPTKVYGYGEKSFSFLLFAKFVRKSFFPKIGLKKNMISNIYVDDLINALVLLTENGKNGETYILTAPNSISQVDIIKIIAKKLHKKVHFFYVPRFLMLFVASIIEISSAILSKKPFVTKNNIKSMCNNRVYDISKSCSEINFYPKISMEQGLNKVLDYYIKQDLL